MRTRKTFPASGIFSVRRGAIATSHYLSEADEYRYRYVQPAGIATPSSYVADCWLVDKNGAVNPGTNVSPVPIRRELIMRRVA